MEPSELREIAFQKQMKRIQGEMGIAEQDERENGALERVEGFRKSRSKNNKCVYCGGHARKKYCDNCRKKGKAIRAKIRLEERRKENEQ